MTNRGVQLLFLSIFAMQAEALVYSSTTKFKLTDTRVKAEDFQNYILSAPKAPEPVAQVAKKVPEVGEDFVRLPKRKAPPHTEAIDLSAVRGSIPARHPQEARIFVVDEEALLNGQIKPIPLARVFPVGPLFPSTLIMTAKNGAAKIPYPFSESLRFFVRARGYMMGMGYATFGNVTVVPLVSKRRFSVLAKSLNLTIPAGQVALFGRIMDQNLHGIDDAQVQFKGTKPGIVYSGPFMGGIQGYFSEDFQKTDGVGSFIANGLSRSQHNISILHNERPIPGFRLDLSGLPDSIRFLSVGFQNGPAINIASTVLDGENFERPDCGLQTLVSNHAKPSVPDGEGNIWIESKFRPTVNELVVKTDKCEGYLPTYVSQASHESLFPPTVGLFTVEGIQETLVNLHRTWEPSQSIVLGHVYPQKDFKHPTIKEVEISVFDSSGEAVPSEILYFNSENELDPRKTSTDAHHQNFLVLGLEPGEYHFFYRNSVDGSDLGIQVVRVYRGGVTQVDF